jgi:hypothetical protein
MERRLFKALHEKVIPGMSPTIDGQTRQSTILLSSLNVCLCMRKVKKIK